ncbi:MAG: Recombination protein RecR [Candidatus Anoxychlamydiales bacterium]|nr:Recombination protein RecR [Candidatus Anoxychlamydiales bacterium]
MYPKDLIKLISYLKKLPGVGSKTAERFSFEMIKWGDSELKDLGDLLKEFKNKIFTCQTCGCLKSNNDCMFCDKNMRDESLLCIVSSFRDIYLLEATNSFKGLYHVLDHLYSPIDDQDLDLTNLKNRIINSEIQEVIIALDSTIEGDATSLYIKEELKNFNVKISRLAFGMPMGSSLEYVDEGTLTQAFIGRQKY